MYDNSWFRGEKKTSMTNVCLLGWRCAFRKQSLPAACETQSEGPGRLRGPPCPLVMNCRKGHHGLLLRKRTAKSKVRRGKGRGRKRSFESGNYDLLTAFFSFLIICLSADTTLIRNGQVGPGRDQGFDWHLCRGNAGRRVPGFFGGSGSFWGQ